MSLVQLKDKGQVTIPAAIREKIAASKGDLFEVLLVGGDIVLRPQEVIVRRSINDKLEYYDIRSYIGSGSGLFKTPEEVDAFIEAERDKWD